MKNLLEPNTFNTPKFKKSVAAELLADEDTTAFILMAILLDAFESEDIFETETALLFEEIESKFGIKFPEENENKVNAAITAMTTDLFYRNFDVFTAIALAFSEGDIGDLADGGDEDLDTCEIIWAIVEVALLNGTTFAESVFPEHMEKRINAIVEEEAEDLEEVDEEVDTLSEALVDNYYQRYVTVKLLDIAKDLIKLDVSREVIEELLNSHNRSLRELREE